MTVLLYRPSSTAQSPAATARAAQHGVTVICQDDALYLDAD